MRIAQLAPLVEPIPPSGYGGTELVVATLTDELVARGHQVTLFASGDSRTRAELVSVTPRALRASTEIPVRRWAAYDIRALLELERRAGQFDLVHNHMGWQALPFLRALPCPTVTTCHNPIKGYCQDIYLSCGDLPYVAISEAYRRLNHPDRLNYVATVYNGIDTGLYGGDCDGERGYLLFLGRICHDKGTREAIEIARRVGLPLKIAGKVDPADSDYFNSQVKPCLNDTEIQFIGEVALDQKIALYRQAIAVVYPINFDEPFGLVMAEALAAGCPVLATDRGSVREVVADGETGIIAGSVDELVARFPEVKEISGGTCRDRAFQLFGKERMADEYLAVYSRLTASRRSRDS